MPSFYKPPRKSIFYPKKYRGRKKKKGRSKPMQRGTSTSLYRNVYAPLARKSRVVFKYQTDVILNPGPAGIAATHVFSMNGCYDPDITGVGHQVRGFDQLMQLFDHFVVISSSIQVDFHNTDTAQGQLCVISARDGAGALTSINDYLEDSKSVYKAASDATAGQNLATVRTTLDPNRFLGRSKPLSDPELKGSSSGNPSEQAYWHVSVAPIDSTTDPSPVQCNVMLSYVAMLIEPANPAQS